MTARALASIAAFLYPYPDILGEQRLQRPAELRSSWAQRRGLTAAQRHDLIEYLKAR